MVENGSVSSEGTRIDRAKIELALNLLYSDPNRTWQSIAEEAGVDVRTIYRWRQTEMWDIVQREMFEHELETLKPHVVAGFKKAFKMGRMAGVAELFKAMGVLTQHEDGSAFVLNIPKQLEASDTKVPTSSEGA